MFQPLLAPTASQLLGGLSAMHCAVVGSHSALDDCQAHCSLAVTLVDTFCALPVCPPGFCRQAEPTGCCMRSGCTLLSLDGVVGFPPVCAIFM